jgi:hypothetical protein
MNVASRPVSRGRSPNVSDLRARNDSTPFREFEEARGHDGAHRVTTDVLGVGVAAAIAKEPRHWTYRADIEFFTKHILGFIAPAAAALAVAISQHRLHFGILIHLRRPDCPPLKTAFQGSQQGMLLCGQVRHCPRPTCFGPIL